MSLSFWSSAAAPAAPAVADPVSSPPRPTSFYDAYGFTFARHLEAHWLEIHREFEGIRAEMMDWFERELYNEGWKVFVLFHPNGQKVAENAARCPVTTQLIEATIPTHGLASFSLLKPHAHIWPHGGYQGKFLRCHLGLEIPTGDCALRVDDRTEPWRAGRAMIFDDRLEHEAWNHTDHGRAVLLLDFVPSPEVLVKAR